MTAPSGASLQAALAALAVAVAGILCPSAALAKDSLVLSPAVSVSQEYIDNVFFTAGDAETDSVTRVDPSLTLQNRGEKGSSSIGIGARMRKYLEYSELDAIDPWIKARFKRRLTDRVRVFGNAKYKRQFSSDPVQDGTAEIYSARADIETMSFLGGLTRQLTPSISATGSAHYFSVSYDEGSANRFDNLTDYDVKGVELAFDRGLSPVEAVGMRLAYRNTGIDESRSLGSTLRDSRDDHLFRVAANWVKTWSPKFSSNLELGVRYLSTDGGSVVGLTEGVDQVPVDTEPDPSVSFVGAALFSYKTRLSLSTLSLTRETRPNNGSRASQNIDQVEARYSRTLGRRFKLSSHVSYQHSSSASDVLQPLPISGPCDRPGEQNGVPICLVDVESALDEEYWKASVELSWKIRERWSTFVSYSYQKYANDRPSSLSGGYDANRITFGFRWSHEVPL